GAERPRRGARRPRVPRARGRGRGAAAGGSRTRHRRDAGAGRDCRLVARGRAAGSRAGAGGDHMTRVPTALLALAIGGVALLAAVAERLLRPAPEAVALGAALLGFVTLLAFGRARGLARAGALAVGAGAGAYAALLLARGWAWADAQSGAWLALGAAMGALLVGLG